MESNSTISIGTSLVNHSCYDGDRVTIKTPKGCYDTTLSSLTNLFLTNVDTIMKENPTGFYSYKES